MALLEQIQDDVKTAMKSGEKDRVRALRLVASELQKAVKDGQSDEVAVLQRDPDRFASIARRAAERLAGEPVPVDEPLDQTRRRAGL